MRLRQQYPQNYGTSGNISTEFENVIRYLNAAEFGSKTIGELLAVLFDENGVFDGPIEIRVNGNDLQYRVGEYSDDTLGWITIAPMDEIRGQNGLDIGTIGTPIITDRIDYAATLGQTVFAYAFEDTDDVLVFKNGLLQNEGVSAAYTKNATSDTVTFNSGLTGTDKVTIYKIRADIITGYNRQDYTVVGSQQVFGFDHAIGDSLMVYKNGILMREGGGNDFTSQPDPNNTITFSAPLGPGETVSIILSENAAATVVSGLMTTEAYAHADSGLVRLDRIRIDNGAITQAKVANLSADLAVKAKITVAASPPVSPATGDLFLDTSVVPAKLKFYDGTQFLDTTPSNTLPAYTISNAGQFIKVNNTGTAYIYSDIDLSSTIPLTQKGAANGVATLDSTGRLPGTQLPSTVSRDSYWLTVPTPAASTTYTVQRIYKQKVRIEGIVISTTSGSCTLQISVEGVSVGSVYTANASGDTITLSTPIEVDANAAMRTIGVTVNTNSSAANLAITLAVAIITT